MAIEKKILLQQSDFKYLNLLTFDWRKKIVKKLRSTRYLVKEINNRKFSDIYDELKKLEISSEYMEHIIIIKLFLNINKLNTSQLPSEEICNLNLRNYFLSLKINNIDYEHFIKLVIRN